MVRACELAFLCRQGMLASLGSAFYFANRVVIFRCLEGGERELAFEVVTATEPPVGRMSTQEQKAELLESAAMRDYLEAHEAKVEDRETYKKNFFERQLNRPVEKETCFERDGQRIVTNHPEAVVRLTLQEIAITDENKTAYARPSGMLSSEGTEVLCNSLTICVRASVCVCGRYLRSWLESKTSEVDAQVLTGAL